MNESSDLILVIAEKDSPSDDELICVRVLASNGSFVAPGTPILELEGAKSVFEVEASGKGYFYSIVKVGDKILLGSVLGYLAQETLTSDELAEISGSQPILAESIMQTPESRLSEPAQKFLRENNVDLELIRLHLPETGLITTETLKSAIELSTFSKFELKFMTPTGINEWRKLISTHRDRSPCILIGGGTSALQALELLVLDGRYFPTGYLSKELSNEIDCIGLERLGGTGESDFIALAKAKPEARFVLTTGSSPSFRFFVLEMSMKYKFDLISLIHPSSSVGQNSEIGVGTLVYGGVHIGSDTRIGRGCYISSNSTIEHHNVIGEAFCSGPNFSSSGCVVIGNRVRTGISVSIEPFLEIGDDALIASGITLTKSVKANDVVKAKN